MTNNTRLRYDRRAELLAAGRVILAKKGLEATTVSEIVAQAGVAQGTFYFYFPSKVSLVVALTQEMTEHVLAAVREAAARANTPGEIVDATVAAAFEAMERWSVEKGMSNGFTRICS